MTRLDALIISSADDLHAQVVSQEIEKLGCKSLIVDSAHYPSRYVVDVEYPFRGPIRLVDIVDSRDWSIDSDCGIWWRRPRSHSIAPTIAHPKLRSFAIDECRQSFLGALLTRCPKFFNRVGPSRQATIKPFQLQIASDLGFQIPRTLITTDPDSARRFIENLNLNCVYKPFTGTDFGFFETRRFKAEEDLRDLWRIRDCPIQIQEYIPGTHDLRVTVVGSSIFCAAMDLSKSRHGVDCRVDRLPTEAFCLSGQVTEKTRLLTREMGLQYAAIDLRMKENGDIVFFEINPEGQYLWIEIDTNLPISSTIAKWLCRPLDLNGDIYFEENQSIQEVEPL